MLNSTSLDGFLVQWGDRLFFPSNRIVGASTPHLTGAALHDRAMSVRQRIQATVVRRAPQVMVKVTGGGRGMGAIAAHFRYISKGGRLAFEDDRGVAREGKEALRDLADQWRTGGAHIPETSPRREAFNVMLSMPAGTDPQIVQRAAREFAKAELANHRYVMVLHTHQANPHVHLSVRAEGRDGQRLNPRKADLHRWRETFAERLRGWGIEAEASSQATRGARHRNERVWERKVRRSTEPQSAQASQRPSAGRVRSLQAWIAIGRALAASSEASDRKLSESIVRYVREMPAARALLRERAQQRELPGIDRVPVPAISRGRGNPDMER
jgi:hypothetical protein